MIFVPWAAMPFSKSAARRKNELVDENLHVSLLVGPL